MRSSDVSAFYAATEKNASIEKEIEDALPGVQPVCLFYSNDNLHYGIGFAYGTTLRTCLENCRTPYSLIISESSLSQGCAIKSAVEKYEKESAQYNGKVLLHNVSLNSGPTGPLYEWAAKFDANADLVIGETNVLLGSYKGEDK